MHRIFREAHKRLIKAQYTRIPRFSEETSLIYYRFPKKDFANLVESPCFVQIPEEAPNIILSSKIIRRELKIQEKKICQHCKVRNLCPNVNEIPLEENTNPINNFNNILKGLASCSQQSYPTDKWISAYRLLPTLKSIIDDLQINNAFETKLFQSQRQYYLQNRVHEDNKDHKKPTNPKQKENIKQKVLTQKIIKQVITLKDQIHFDIIKPEKNANKNNKKLQDPTFSNQENLSQHKKDQQFEYNKHSKKNMTRRRKYPVTTTSAI